LSDNANRAARAPRKRIPPTFAEVETALCALPKSTNIEMRDRAIFAFVIVTGVRVDSLVSLKIKDVDARRKTVWQNPKHVRTKRRKGIVTRLMGQLMPYAEEIVLDWMQYTNEVLHLKPNDPLFPSTLVENNPQTMAFEVQGLSKKHWANAQPVREIFKKVFKAAELPYFNPHLIRKTIVNWSLKNCTQREFKAISQNLGHEHAMTTYNSYGTLTDDEQLDLISNIGKANSDLQNISMDDILAEVSRRTGK